MCASKRGDRPSPAVMAGTGSAMTEKAVTRPDKPLILAPYVRRPRRDRGRLILLRSGGVTAEVWFDKRAMRGLGLFDSRRGVGPVRPYGQA